MVYLKGQVALAHNAELNNGGIGHLLFTQLGHPGSKTMNKMMKIIKGVPNQWDDSGYS
jgi:hypothetical protein